jgi:hypothetical protein
MIDLL